MARRKRRHLADEYEDMIRKSIQSGIDRDEERAVSKQKKLKAKIIRALAMQGEANKLHQKLNIKYWQDAVVGTGTTLKGQVYMLHVTRVCGLCLYIWYVCVNV